MHYRIVCSTEDFQMDEYQEIYVTDDCYEIEDFIIIVDNYKKILCCLNPKMINSSMVFKKSIIVTGVVLIISDDSQISLSEIVRRYAKGENKMAEKKKSEINVEELVEEQIMYSDDDLYNINSWGADLSFREIISMYDEDELLKPELQRKYVWTKVEASRFIDSILLGLPVPSVFFAKEPNETMLIIDGFQRIMTVYDYVNGIFSGDGKVFKLSNTENINCRWRGKAFAELEADEKRRIRNTTIHAIIFEQKYPRNDTGMFQIFERINTGGRTLKPQEIRNCVYQGTCNELLFELNKNTNWRLILGMQAEDVRMADIELILRFFAMSELISRNEINSKQINLARYLNNYMGDKAKADNTEIDRMRNSFINMIAACAKVYGVDSFRNLKGDLAGFTSKLNPAVYDAVSVATAYAIEKGVFDEELDYKNKYIELLKDDEFKSITSHRTTNTENIIKRINMAAEKIYGIKYES